MGDIINLRQARKAKARAEGAAKAAGNRAAFGRTKAERQAEAAAREKARRALDAAKIDDE
ncbi:MAG TPA: DUF4169 family protein [Allosphingosinicella sp.]